ncbi:hypothetical protein IWQ62_001255 [Dispira parvispora]|uniref:DUF7137 domain-containing protein n=1 Tax=Dispira parvispora TaxID=1520584 RepID=A0A9W8ASV5_9FUNG|nr:hypothetical protein IWQ62_001255 [Dispira parvispora]
MRCEYLLLLSTILACGAVAFSTPSNPLLTNRDLSRLAQQGASFQKLLRRQDSPSSSDSNDKKDSPSDSKETTSSSDKKDTSSDSKETTSSSDKSSNDKESSDETPTKTDKDKSSSSSDSDNKDESVDPAFEDQEGIDAVARVVMVEPPASVATPVFEFDQPIDFKWKYTGLTDPPESITITIAIPVIEKPGTFSFYELGNTSASTTEWTWDPATEKPSNMNLPEKGEYKFLIYNADLGREQTETNYGSLSQFTMKFRMYRSSYNDQSKCTDCIIASDDYSSASGVYLNAAITWCLGGFVVTLLHLL